MSDFNRKGTPTSKIMTYDRYHLRKVHTTLKCDDEMDFHLYFKININNGSIYNTFLLLSTSNQIEVLKKFISKIYIVSLDKIIIEEIAFSSIRFKVKILNIPSETEDIQYSLINVKNSLVYSMNVVLGTTFTHANLDPLMTFEKSKFPFPGPVVPTTTPVTPPVTPPPEPEPEPLPEPEPEPEQPQPEPEPEPAILLAFIKLLS